MTETGNRSKSQKKRIGIFTDYQRGGVYVFSTRLAEELKNNYPYEIHIVTFHGSTERDKHALAGLRDVSHQMHLISRSESAFSLIQSLCSILRNSEFDVFVPNYRYFTYAAAAKTGPVTKVIGICHDNDISYYDLLHRYETIIDAFICPSFATQSCLAKRLPHRKNDIHYIAHGVPALDCGPYYEGGPLELVYNGRLDENHKKISYLLAIAKKLEERSIPFHLNLIGDGPDEEDYKRKVRQVGLSSRIRFHGYRDVKDAMQIAGRSHITVLTSLHEGFCYGIAEAMVMGLPPVAFSCGGVIEQYLKDGVNGYVVPWGDVDSAADRIGEFYQNPEKWKRFSVEARKEMETNYSMAAFGRSYALLIDRIISDGQESREWPKMRPVVAEQNLATRLLEKAGLLIRLW